MAERSRIRAPELPAEPDPHAGHHQHLEGTGVICSCGEFIGVTCVIIPDDFDETAISCSICGQVGVAG